MRKIIIILLLLFFSSVLFVGNRVWASNSDLIDTTPPLIMNTHNFDYEIGQDIPNYKQNIEVIDESEYILIVSDDFVNYQEEGRYPLYYYAGDSNGNTTTVTVYVNVFVDITKPLFSGLENKELEFGLELTEEFLLEGVSVYDNIDGDLTSDIIIDFSNVNVASIGTYTVTYSVTDSHHNIKVENIQLSIVDNVSPEISGYKNHTVEVFTPSIDYLDGVEAMDLYDGNVLVNIDDTNVNLNCVGQYDVTLSAVDSSGNETNERIIVNVVDTNSPEISGYKNYTVEVFTSSIDYLDGVIATDLYDQNVLLSVDDSLVDLNELGQYEVIISATDSSGNVTQETIKVNVVDTTPPEIIGAKDFMLEVTLTDCDYIQDAVAKDLYDGEVEIVVDHSQVNINELGDYEITLSAIDSSGNETIIVLTVSVVDTTPPNISGYKNYFVEVFTPSIDYLDGVVATDLYDGFVEVTCDSTEVDLNTVGHYEVSYYAVDQHGNEEIITVNVSVVDIISPEFISYTDLFIYNIGDPLPNLLEGLEIRDNYDGIISDDKVIVYSQHVDFTKGGTYIISYVVYDSSMNVSNISTEIKVIDTEAPNLIVPSDFRISLTNQDIDFLEGVFAIDNASGILTDKIFVDDSQVNYDQVGHYPVKYIVSDSSGNITTMVRMVQVFKDVSPPEISGTLSYVVEVYSNPINFLSNLDIIDDFDPNPIISIHDEEVNYNILGGYSVFVEAIDANQNALTKTIFVCIVDTEKPVISGHKNITIKKGKEFNPIKNISVEDNYDKDLIEEIEIISEYDINKEGKYVITLRVSDSSQNMTEVSYVLTVVHNNWIYILMIGIGAIGITGTGLVMVVTKRKK